jgi:hypothetical protein
VPQRCSICTRGDVAAVNGLLLDGRSALSVARDLGLSEDAVQRHKKGGHAKIVTIPVKVVAKPTEDPIDELVTVLRNKALNNSNDAAMVHQYRLALAAQKETKSAVGQVRELGTDPEWLALAAKILAALDPFPEARLAVSVALA